MVIANPKGMQDDAFTRTIIWYRDVNRIIYLEMRELGLETTTQSIRKIYGKNRPAATCLYACLKGQEAREVNWEALYGPFMAIVRNRVPCYAADAQCLIKMPGGGNYLFFEEQ